MHHHQQHQAKRRKKRILHGTKTVTVVRGKLGYGFTISGQNPCMLSSIVAGSPADQAGLKPGDMLYFVNGLNVSSACHDDVVRMVGLSTGSLELQVAENCNSSDSSDDDYLPRNKSRYPNRVRQRNASIERGGKGYTRHEGKRLQKPIPEDSDPSFSPASTDDIPWTKPTTTRLSKHDIRTSGNDGPHGQGNTKARDGDGFAFSSVQKGAVVSTAKISSAAAVVKRVPPMSVTSRHGRQLSFPQAQVLSERPQNLWRHSSGPAIPFRGSEIDEEEEEAEAMPVVADSARAVVGYIGSIEMPSSHTRPHQRLQALRNAVRRLRLEKRVHTLVLMQVSSSGITLSNAVGKEVASYPTNRIAFSGICPDDKHFFGLVTLGLPDDSSSQIGAEGGGQISSSCHIFMIEPELSSHSAHMQQADIFEIKCTTHPQTRRCEEFPVSATSLILCIANLYRDGPPRQFDNEIVQSHAFADPVRQGQRINSNSSSNGNNSNSDSGLGFGREDAPLEQNEQVCVVDLPNSNSSGSSAATIDTSGMSVTHHLSPDAFACGTPRAPHSAQRPLSSYDIRRGLNNSTSSEECWQSSQAALNKLTPRAMPDPAHKLRSRSAADLTPTSLTMDDMRQSMQRLLQARQRQLQEQNLHLESDRDSAVGNPVLSLSVAENGQVILEGGQSLDHVFAVPSEPPPGSSHHHSASSSTVRSAFQVPRPVSAPLSRQKTPTLGQPETIDLETMGKLSPRAFPDAGSPPSAFRSPSAPPAPFFPHRESDDDDDDDDDEIENEDDPYIRQILDQFRRDRAVKKTEDNRRFSEGFAIMQKREKEKYEAGNLQKWSKSSSLKRGQPQPMMLKQSFSQSHESLAVHDEEPPPLPSSHRLVTASSVNNMTRQADQDVDGFSPSQPGRVAEWAVNFDKLLQDPIGLSVFTGFLKKEFSEENVIFWKACEQYRKISDDQHRKAQAQEIYGRHLSSKASDPVNVDSAAKLYTEKFLDKPTAIMFDVAQQQIFQLMRQDSYSRFLKSDMYKGYLVKEIEGQRLIDPATGNPESNGNGKGEKKKGKGKENEEKRRRSILPWRQNKKSSLKSTSDPEPKKLSKRSKDDKVKEKEPNNNMSGEDSSNLKVVIADTSTLNPADSSTIGVSQGKKVVGSGIDLSTMRKEVFHTKDKEVRDAPESQFKFCRIMLPDGSTTVVCAKPGQSCRLVVSKLCEKRSIALASVDVYLHGSNKTLDLEEDISVLGSKEIIIEKRVLFRLDMPNVKSIGVKAKPNRSVSEVFRPILQKYGFSLESTTILVTGSQDPVDFEDSVSCLDKQRVTVVSTDSAEQPGLLPLSARQSKTASTAAGKNKNNNNNIASGRGGAGGGSLEEITNQIFDDLMRGKSQLAHGFDELGVVELDKPKVNKNEEGRSLGLFGLLRRESWGAKDRRPKGKGKVTFTLPGNDAKKKKAKDGEKLIRLLSGAQELRLEDQRGVEISTGEMPSFLHQDGKGNSSHHNRHHDHHHHHNQQQQQQLGVLEVHMEEEDVATDLTATGLDRVMDGGDARLTKSPSKGRRSQQQQNNVTPRAISSTRVSPSPSNVTPSATPRTRGANDSLGSNSKGILSSSEKWNQHNKSFGPDSIIPSPNTASLYFQMSPEIVEMHKRSLNNYSPHSNNYSPHNNSQSPHSNTYSPHINSQSPHSNSESPHNNSHSPHSNTYSPHNNSQSPHSNYSPYNNSQSPHSNNHSPHNLNHSYSPKTVSSHPEPDNYADPVSFKPPPPYHDSIQSAHSSFYTPTKAPVASPEKFSPNNQIPSSPTSAMMLLPSKMSPTLPSSNSSSSSSSSIKRRPSAATKQQQPQNISRMSDGMLLHKLQKARHSNSSPKNGNWNPLSNSQIFSDSRNRSPAADLAQRALLSPRFNNNEETHLDMTHSQRALLSPRLDHSHPSTNMSSHHNTNTQNFHDFYNRRSTPSPVRNSNSPYKVNPSIDSHVVEPRPISSSAGPQFSNWHNKSYLMNTSQLESPYHSPVGKQGSFKTEYLQDVGETVTFV